METAVQLVLIFSVFSLTIIFIVVGVWAVLILKEVKKIVKKASDIGDDVEDTAKFVKEKVKEGFNLVAVLTTLNTLWTKEGRVKNLLANLQEKEKERVVNKVKKEEVKKKKKTKPSPLKKKRRFFIKRK